MSVTPATIQRRVPARKLIMPATSPAPRAALRRPRARQSAVGLSEAQCESRRKKFGVQAHQPIAWPPAPRYTDRQQTRRVTLFPLQPSLPIELSPPKDPVRVHPVRSRHACNRSAGHQRLLDDPPLLLYRAESPLRPTASHLDGLRSVHDSPLWTRSSCPQRSSSLPSDCPSTRPKPDAYVFAVCDVAGATQPVGVARATLPACLCPSAGFRAARPKTLGRGGGPGGLAHMVWAVGTRFQGA